MYTVRLVRLSGLPCAELELEPSATIADVLRTLVLWGPCSAFLGENTVPAFCQGALVKHGVRAVLLVASRDARLLKETFEG